MTIHPIEVESYRRMRALIDFTAWSEPARIVVERMVHATADADYAQCAHVGDEVIERAIEALRAGSAVITDAHMVRMGLVGLSELTGTDAHCYLDAVTDHDRDGRGRDDTLLTRSAAAIRLAATAHPRGAVFVIGNAPTALSELLALHRTGAVEPAVVIGLPVGFVGAAEAKAELIDGPLAARSVSNRGRKGGSAVAAAAMNSILRLCVLSSPATVPAVDW